MSQITIELPEPTLRRFRRGAAAAKKALEEFLAERLAATPVPLADDLPPALRAELAPLEHLDDAALWNAAAQRLSPAEQAEYDSLLAAAARANLSDARQTRLDALGEKARRLTLRRAHAYLILQWRGHTLPSVGDIVAGT